MTDQELNEALVKWRWPECDDTGHSEIVYTSVGDYMRVIDKNDNYVYEGYLFTLSLDACFKWLVPLLNKWGLYICIDQHDYSSGLVFEVIIVDRIGDDTTDLFTNSDLAKALTEAIKQVIDNANKEV